MDDLDRRDRVNYALSRFVFPGCLVPRAAMAEAVLAALDHGDDFVEYLPPKTVIPTGGEEIRPVNTDLLASSLEGRAKSLDQIAAMVRKLPARRKRKWRNYLADELRKEATFARADLTRAARREEKS